jgi:hypothetical protein
MTTRTVVSIMILGWAASAAAQPSAVPSEPPPSDPASAPAMPPSEPPPPGAVPAMMQPMPTTTPPPTTELGTLEDANAGRVAIMPTALMPPAGTWAFEDWELFLISASYSPSDNLIITGTTMIPVTSNFYWGFISAKLKVLRQGNLHVAVQGGVAGVFDNSVSSGGTSDSAGGFDLGGTATYCIDPACYSHLDGAVVAGFARQNNTSVPVGFMGGLVARLGKRVRLIIEADTAHLFGNISGQANGFLGWYGVRFTSRQIGVDLALVKPFCSGGSCDSSTFPLGFPFVTFSYRGLD